VLSSARSDDVTQLHELPVLSDQQLGGDFILYSSQGEFSLQQLRGKVVLLYFGYTKCPDVCPTSLAFLSQALNELSDDEMKSVQGVFVSVDPKRDTFQVLDDYVSYFNPNLVGVTGSENEIEQVAKLYGVKYQEVELEGSAFDYAIDHSSVTYLITPEGDLRFVFPHQTPPFVILEAIRYVLTAE
jgi:protein SCO1/2